MDMIPSARIDVQDWMTAPETAAVMAALESGKALFVGGCVRNALIGRPVTDIDIATTLTSDHVMALIEAAGLTAIPTGIDHGTITAISGRRTFEITTLRRDVATDGRRAVVAFTTDWAEDAARRDFTMNALLADASGHIYDPTGRGIDDLRAGRVIFVGDPAQRIAEDYLRILRFFRFHGSYGQGAPDPAALAACRTAAGDIGRLSRERVTQEILKILGMDDSVSILSLMRENNILPDVPERDYQADILSRLCESQQALDLVNITSRLFVWAGDDVGRIEKYLLLSNAQKKNLQRLSQAIRNVGDLSERLVKQLIYKYSHHIALQTVLIVAAQRDRPPPEFLRALGNWDVPVFPVGGDDVIQAGIKTGPDVGRILTAVEQWWVGKNFQPSRSDCLKKLQDFLTTDERG